MMRTARGFTLLEVLVAVAIFAVLGAMAMTGYVQIAQQRDHLSQSMQRMRAVQLGMTRIVNDFAELEPRSVRDAMGSASMPALLADARAGALVQLTRAGWSNPAGIGRSTLQRVAYRLVDDKLVRDHFTVLDRTLTTEPVSVELLDRVRVIKFRFLDKNRAWTDQWPGLSSAAVGAQQPPADLPIAVEITLELEDFGALTRLVEVPG